MRVLLSTTYFGPVGWYQKLYRAETVRMERWENYQKQTYRNRCVIATANGRQALTVPVEHGDSTLIKDLRISDHGNWRHLHWNALQSAYGDSPFFEYYQDDLRPFFTERWQWLLDFNEAIRSRMCELLDIQPDVDYTERYERPDDCQGWQDYRTAISPKQRGGDGLFEAKTYYQVYQQRHGFMPNLSVLDLLFNMGPESILFL